MISCNWSQPHAREDQIVSGLKRPANGKLAAGQGIGQQAGPGSAAVALAALCGAAAAGVRGALRKVAGWAAGRAIAPNSLTGISLLLALCAAAWFSGGPGGDRARGLIAMGGWLLVMASAGRLAAFTQRQAGATPRSAVRAAGVSDDSTDWLVLPDVVWADEEPAGGGSARAAALGESADTPAAGTPAAAEVSSDDALAGAVSASAVSTGAVSAGAVSAGAVSAGAVSGDSGPGSAGVPDGPGAAAGARGFGWLSALCAVAAECAIYGGIAAGGKPTALIGMWPLAVMTVTSVAVTELLRACRVAAVVAGRCRELGRSPALRRWTGRLLCPPAGVRALLAAAGLAAAGPQGALFTVLAIEVIALTSTAAMLASIALPGPWPDVSPAPPDGLGGRLSPTGSAGTTARAPAARVTAIVGVTGSAGTTSAVRIIAATDAGAGAAAQAGAATEAGPAPQAGGATRTGGATRAGGTAWERGATRAAAGGTGRASWAGGTGQPEGTAAATAPATPTARATAAASSAAAGGPVPGSLDVVIALRDDGRAARWAGRLVQGNLIPLPPAVAGLIATAMLAALGLRGLPGFIAMTPPVVMMLAAPGSSHPHDGRFDWLVPVLLALAQYVYLGALGFALAVPGPVIFSLCALTFLWYAGITAEARTDTAATSARPGPRIGWETRLFVAGLAATFGLATFGYLGLATYLGVLVCRKVLIGYLIPREEDRR